MFLRKVFTALAVPAMILFTISSAMAGGSEEAIEYSDLESKWSGLYVGLHGGYGWTDFNNAYDFGAANNLAFNGVGLSPGLKDNLDGYLVGGQVGFQRQFGAWVIGVEGTLSATGIDATTNAQWSFNNLFGICPGLCFGTAGQGSQSVDAKIDHLYTATARVGYAYDDWLAYVKGGFATADIDVKSDISGNVTGCFFGCLTVPVSTSGTSDKRHDGWTIGGGIERMILPHVTLGVEYNFVDLDERTHSFNAPLQIANFQVPTSYKVRVDPDAIQTVSLRLNFLLNDPNPDVAPLK